MKRIAIFASGGGSNAEAIIQYFKEKENVSVALIVANKSKAFVVERAKTHNIPSIIISRDSFYKEESIVEHLVNYKVDLIVLAGFLWLIPEYLVNAFPQKILNIHPALLPQYGGKGMYGMNVHRAVKENGDEISGITIHYVNNEYDKGKHLFQASVRLSHCSYGSLPEDARCFW